MTATATADRVIEGVSFAGAMNVPHDVLLDQVRAAIRRQHPQVWRQPERPERVVLVGSGPSLEHTVDELVALVREGVVLATVNGAYHWCLERHLVPSVQIVLDARASTARFVQPAIPRCRYFLASQCHADVWDAVADYPHVAIYHALSDDDAATRAVLDAYYAGCWQGVAGGTTVGTRAIGLLRMLGYLRFDLFGLDCCWLGDQHHAMPQPENAQDERLHFRVAPRGRPDLARDFFCSPWQAKAFEDLLLMEKHMSREMRWMVHGDGMFAYAIAAQAYGDVVIEETTGGQ